MRHVGAFHLSVLGLGRQGAGMATTDESELVRYEEVGPRRYLDRLLEEYRLTEGEVRERIQVAIPWPGASEAHYLVHESLLRSHRPFPCAGDTQALRFCQEIAEEMVRRYGIANHEAVARVNRQWSDPGQSGRIPRIWIVGLDIAYHETAHFWAADIYYGHDSRWWSPDARPRPLPPPAR